MGPGILTRYLGGCSGVQTYTGIQPNLFMWGVKKTYFVSLGYSSTERAKDSLVGSVVILLHGIMHACRQDRGPFGLPLPGNDNVLTVVKCNCDRWHDASKRCLCILCPSTSVIVAECQVALGHLTMIFCA